MVLEPLSRISSLECLARSFTPKARESRNKDKLKGDVSVDCPGPCVQDEVEVGRTAGQRDSCYN